jgi:hypothetical protein
MLRYVARALAACASIAAITLLAPTASADLPIHPRLQNLEPTLADVGGDLDPPEDTRFGTAVLIRDQLAFIGMPAGFPGGRVGVYAAGPTALVRTATLVASPAAASGEFGRTLTYRDGILVVGARQAAYVFQRSNGVWTQRQKIAPPAADGVEVFAQALRYENGTLAIGATRNALPGTVYIYERDATGKFIARGKLRSPDASAFDGFGTSISMGGQAMVIGAPGNEAAYIFRRNSAGVWRHNQKLVPSDQSALHPAFGSAVAIDRQMIIVGAPFAGGDLGAPPGAAYVFTPGGGIYVETLKLDPGPELFREDHVLFGRQIVMFDQRIVIGAQSFESDGPLVGFVGFSFTRSGSSVLPRGVITREAFASTSLSLANQRVLVGIGCASESGFCGGRASLYNLNVFE